MKSSLSCSIGKKGREATLCSSGPLTIALDVQNFGFSFSNKKMEEFVRLQHENKVENDPLRRSLWRSYNTRSTESIRISPVWRFNLMKESPFYLEVLGELEELLSNPKALALRLRLDDGLTDRTIQAIHLDDGPGSNDKRQSPSRLKPIVRAIPVPKVGRKIKRGFFKAKAAPDQAKGVLCSNMFDIPGFTSDPESLDTESLEVNAESTSPASPNSGSLILEPLPTNSGVAATCTFHQQPREEFPELQRGPVDAALDAVAGAFESDTASDSASEISDATSLQAYDSNLQADVSLVDSPRVGSASEFPEPSDHVDIFRMQLGSPTSVLPRAQSVSVPAREGSPQRDSRLEGWEGGALWFALYDHLKTKVRLEYIRKVKADHLMTAVFRERYLARGGLNARARVVVATDDFVAVTNDNDFCGVTEKYGVRRVGTDGSPKQPYLYYGVMLSYEMFLVLRALLGGGKLDCCDPAIGPVPLGSKYRDPVGREVEGRSKLSQAGHVPTSKEFWEYVWKVKEGRVWERKLPGVYTFLTKYGKRNGFGGLNENFEANMRALNIDQTDEELAAYRALDDEKIEEIQMKVQEIMNDYFD